MRNLPLYAFCLLAFGLSLFAAQSPKKPPTQPPNPPATNDLSRPYPYKTAIASNDVFTVGRSGTNINVAGSNFLSSMTSGTLADARLSERVALRTSPTNHFTGNLGVAGTLGTAKATAASLVVGSFLISTNYDPANMIPKRGYIKVSGSNFTVYFVSEGGTNAIR